MSIKNMERMLALSPDCIVPTEAIRPGQWLRINTVNAGLTLYVADEDAVDVITLFPDKPVTEIDNYTFDVQRGIRSE